MMMSFTALPGLPETKPKPFQEYFMNEIQQTMERMLNKNTPQETLAPIPTMVSMETQTDTNDDCIYEDELPSRLPKKQPHNSTFKRRYNKPVNWNKTQRSKYSMEEDTDADSFLLVEEQG
jgi:hypothetical protein